MKLLYISLNIGDLEHGAGGWIRTLNILENIPNQDLNITILTTRSGFNLISKAIPNKFEYIILSKKDFPLISFITKLNNRFAILLNWLIYTLIFMITYKKLIVKSYDLIYSDSDFFIDIVPAIKISNLINKPVGCIVHHIVEFDRRGFLNLINFINNFFSKFIQKLSFCFIKKMNFIFIYNNYEGQKITELFKKKYSYTGQFYMVANGIHLKLLDTYLDLNLKKYSNSILFYGAARRNKGFFDIIDFVIETKKSIPNVMLRIGGFFANYEKQYLIHQIKKFSLEKNIKFLGYMSEDQKYKNIVMSNIVIFPSYEEGWGISIMESKYLNKNVICYNIKSLVSLHGNNINFIELGNKKNFALKIIELLNSYKKNNNNAYLYQYDWKKCAEMDYKYFKLIASKNIQ